MNYVYDTQFIRLHSCELKKINKYTYITKHLSKKYLLSNISNTVYQSQVTIYQTQFTIPISVTSHNISNTSHSISVTSHNMSNTSHSISDTSHNIYIKHKSQYIKHKSQYEYIRHNTFIDAFYWKLKSSNRVS